MNGPESLHLAASGPTAPDFMTIDQVGELLQLSAKSIYRLVKDDPTFPALKLGAGRNASVRVPHGRLIRWLEDRTQGAPRMRRQMLSSPKSAPDQEARRA